MQLVLSDSLSDTGSAHSLSEGLCRFGFIRGCARWTTWLNSGLPHQQKRRTIHGINHVIVIDVKVISLLLCCFALDLVRRFCGALHARHQHPSPPPQSCYRARGAFTTTSALLALQRAEDPDTALTLFEVAGDDLLEGLLEGRYDVGVSLSEASSPAFKTQPLWIENMAVAIPLQFPLLDQAALTISDYMTARSSLAGRGLPLAGSPAVLPPTCGPTKPSDRYLLRDDGATGRGRLRDRGIRAIAH